MVSYESWYFIIIELMCFYKIILLKLFFSNRKYAFIWYKVGFTCCKLNLAASGKPIEDIFGFVFDALQNAESHDGGSSFNILNTPQISQLWENGQTPTTSKWF